MIPGLNETVRFGERAYHIQTEDLGTNKALVVSQIFCEGRILHSKRTEYRDKLALPNLEVEVRKLLLRQHRDMHRLIQQGEMDRKLDGIQALGPAAAPASPAAAADAAGSSLPAAPAPSTPASSAAPAEIPGQARAARPAGEAEPSGEAADVSRPASGSAGSLLELTTVSPSSELEPGRGQPADDRCDTTLPEGQKRVALEQQAEAAAGAAAAGGHAGPPDSSAELPFRIPRAEGFLADLISDRRLDLVIVLELARMDAESHA